MQINCMFYKLRLLKRLTYVEQVPTSDKVITIVLHVHWTVKSVWPIKSNTADLHYVDSYFRHVLKAFTYHLFCYLITYFSNLVVLHIKPLCMVNFVVTYFIIYFSSGARSRLVCRYSSGLFHHCLRHTDI